MLSEVKFNDRRGKVRIIKDVNNISSHETNPLALNYNNSLDINEYWKLNRKDRTESNADMLNQSFGTKTETNTTPIEDNKEMQNEASKIQISPIPSVQKTDLEKKPASLNTGIVNSIDLDNTNVVDNNNQNYEKSESTINMNYNNENSIGINDSLNSNITNLNEKKVEVIEEKTNESLVSTSNANDNQPIIKDETIINNDFNLNNGENWFDKPENNPKAFGQESIENTFDNVKTESNNEKNDLYELKEKEIALIEKEIKNQEELIEIKKEIANTKRQIILLESQNKEEVNEINHENTASNLFNNNGVLDEEQVLGETPMPTLRAA